MVANQPIGQSKDEEFNKGRFQEQLLVIVAKVCEPWYGFSPLFDHVHGTRQQVVELLDIP